MKRQTAGCHSDWVGERMQLKLVLQLKPLVIFLDFSLLQQQHLLPNNEANTIHREEHDTYINKQIYKLKKQAHCSKYSVIT